MFALNSVIGLRYYLHIIDEDILVLKWEITYRLHPERFSTQTNESLSCAMCQEKLCQHKT